MGNNFFEFFFPYNIDINFQDIIKREGTIKDDFDQDFTNFKKIIEEAINRTSF